MKRNIEYIESVICAEEKIEAIKLHSKIRRRDICDIRQMIMYFALLFGNTEAMTGCYFERDHATAHNAKISVQNLYDTDKGVREKIEQYSEIIKRGKDNCDYINNRVIKIKKEISELVAQLEKITP